MPIHSLKEQCHYFQVQIVDEGRGIPDYDLPNLFERFYQGHGDQYPSFIKMGELEWR
ncbi:ATP-binding protein [Synechocystis salina]|uniref:ATP-binding protein n=1 Tax=Synechocystis salina TaxID=945780 RepID=UPI001D14BA34|nr:ATP-binding protein [Synechocystis salina]